VDRKAREREREKFVIGSYQLEIIAREKRKNVFLLL
jgi:hypothetical protein